MFNSSEKAEVSLMKKALKQLQLLMAHSTPPVDNFTVTVPWVQLLAALNSNKAPEPDAIPCQLLKELAEELAPILTSLYKQSQSLGMLPDDWL